jgi:hypothetical protein
MAARRTYYRQILKRAKSVRAVEACVITSTIIAFKSNALPAGCIWGLPGSPQIVPLGHHGVRSGVSRATAANIPRRSSSININMRAKVKYSRYIFYTPLNLGSLYGTTNCTANGERRKNVKTDAITYYLP